MIEMNKLEKFVMLSLAVILSITSINMNRNNVQAFTPPLITNSGITYPISLDTGKDAAGKLVFPDKEFLEYVSNAVFQSGNYYGKKFDLNHDGNNSQVTYGRHQEMMQGKQQLFQQCGNRKVVTS